MAFPILSSQQETNRKILEDLQLKKQLLQKGVSPVAGSIPNFGAAQGFGTPGLITQLPTSHQLLPVQSIESSINPTARTAFNQASIQSFGFFVPQDSCYGNSILPVLPRLESTTIPQTK